MITTWLNHRLITSGIYVLMVKQSVTSANYYAGAYLIGLVNKMFTQWTTVLADYSLFYLFRQN